MDWNKWNFERPMLPVSHAKDQNNKSRPCIYSVSLRKSAAAFKITFEIFFSFCLFIS
jgi:hypothetical protein